MKRSIVIVLAALMAITGVENSSATCTNNLIGYMHGHVNITGYMPLTFSCSDGDNGGVTCPTFAVPIYGGTNSLYCFPRGSYCSMSGIEILPGFSAGYVVLIKTNSTGGIAAYALTLA